jgi:DNA-directed RNA polymerase subunit M/transcription elongation factor TFIIS
MIEGIVHNGVIYELEWDIDRYGHGVVTIPTLERCPKCLAESVWDAQTSWLRTDAEPSTTIYCRECDASFDVKHLPR